MYFDMSIKIERGGAIVVGKNFTIDGHSKRNFRIVSHFHADHILGLSKSINECLGIIATPQTLDVLEILGYKIPFKKKFGLKYNLNLDMEGESISLKPAEHILGSAQVYVKLEDGTSIGYTSDFKNPGNGTPILDSDILVLDSTYGKPEFRRSFKQEIEYLFPDYIRDSLINGPVRIYAYHGKIQEVMKFLRKSGIDAPFLAEGKIFEITKVAKKYGEKIDNVFDIKDEESKDIIKDGWYIEFKHFNEFKKRSGEFSNFLLSGWQFNVPIRKMDNKTFVVAFSDHGDFDETRYYVDNSPAKTIITDGGRNGYSKELAKYIREKLKRNAFSLP